jgi:hypothetical protein
MWKRCAAGLLIGMISSLTADADSIIIDGKIYRDVRVYKSSNRYYIRFSDGSTMGVPFSEVKEDEVAYGDEPLPALQSPPPEPEPEPAPEPEPEPEPEPVPEPGPVAAEEAFLPLLLPEAAPLEAGSGKSYLDTAPETGQRLEADAIVVRSGGVSVAFCAADTCALDSALRDAVVARLQSQGSAIGKDNLILSATGAATAWRPGAAAAGLPEPALTAAEASVPLAQAIVQAEVTLQPAAIRLTETDAPAFQRVRPNASTTSDATLSVMGIYSASGAPLAMLVNYALLPPCSAVADIPPGRGLPGAVAAAIREDLQRDIPVLFTNGAAGDLLSPAPPETGAQIGRMALAALASAEPRRETALACRSRLVDPPPSLLAAALPETALLQEVRIDDTAFLSMPGAPAAQTGLLLRVKGFLSGLQHAFLLAHTGGCAGFQPAPEEYFAAAPESLAAITGPLSVKWYGDMHLPLPEEEEPIWMNVPVLAQYANTFQRAMDRGRADKAKLIAAWDTARAALIERDIPENSRVPADAPAARRDGLRLLRMANRIRADALDPAREEQVILMGIAEGAELPFEAVLLLQALAAPEPDRAAFLPADIAGIDFLER